MTAYDYVLIRHLTWDQRQSCHEASTRLQRSSQNGGTMPLTSVGRPYKLKETRLCVQVMSTVLGRGLPSVVTGTLALVHASGAIEPLTFLHHDPSIQDLEYLASLITAHIQRRQVIAGTRSEHRAREGTALLAETGAEDAIVIENELQPSLLTDIYRRPSFADTTPSGTSSPQHPAAQQAAHLGRLSDWDADGYALLRAAPRLISHRATVCCDATAQTITVTIAPDSDIADGELDWKAQLQYACLAVLLCLLLPLGLFFVLCIVLWAVSIAKSSSETQKQERFEAVVSIIFSAPMLLLMTTLLLVGRAILTAPRDVTLTVGTTAWKLESHLKGFKLFPFLQRTSTGETDAHCGCRVCALCLPPLHNWQDHSNNHWFVRTTAVHETRAVLRKVQPCCLLPHLDNSSAALGHGMADAEHPTHPRSQCVPAAHCRPPPACAPAFCLFLTVIPASEVRW
jgi:hypothetical protein